jgi:hypothetical protein
MKRIATIILVSLILSTNYSYATLSIEEMTPTIKAALTEKQIQETIEELFAAIIIRLMEGNGVDALSLNELGFEGEGLTPNQQFTGNPIYDLILVLVYGVYFIIQLAASLVEGIVYTVTWVVQVLANIFLNFPEILVNFISFIVNLVVGVLEIFLGASTDIIFYLLPLILTIISIIIDDIDIVI